MTRGVGGRFRIGRRAAVGGVAGLAAAGVTPARKTFVVDVQQLGHAAEKLEGLAIVDRQTLAICNDNDFGFAGFGPDGRAIPGGLPTQLHLIRLPWAL